MLEFSIFAVAFVFATLSVIIYFCRMFEPLLGPRSLTFANGTDGRVRRNLYDKGFTHGAVRKYFTMFQQFAEELAKKWETRLNGEHIPLCQSMATVAFKAVLKSLHGETMSDSTSLRFSTLYDKIFNEFERSLTEPLTPEREKMFEKDRKELMEISKEMVKNKKKLPSEHADEYILDLILDITEDEDQQFSDTLTFIVAGFHTTGTIPVMSWMLYFLATYSDVQDKVYNEINEVLGEENLDHTNIGDFRYLRQVQDETMRCSVLAPLAARFQGFDSEIGGHKIPKNTPVIHALGVCLQDENVWPLPNQFDPDRFSPENVASRSRLSFVPFGFAGKRTCPGQRFAYAEATVIMVTLLRKYKVKMVDGQIIERVYGIVTRPSDEIWITLSKR